MRGLGSSSYTALVSKLHPKECTGGRQDYEADTYQNRGTSIEATKEKQNGMKRDTSIEASKKKQSGMEETEDSEDMGKKQKSGIQQADVTMIDGTEQKKQKGSGAKRALKIVVKDDVCKDKKQNVTEKQKGAEYMKNGKAKKGEWRCVHSKAFHQHRVMAKKSGMSLDEMHSSWRENLAKLKESFAASP